MTLDHDMPYDDYDDLLGWRWSHIKLVNKSPRHVRHAVDNPTSGDTASRRLLRAIHTLVLEPQYFDEEYSVFDGTRSGKKYKAHLANHPDTDVLNPREHEKAKATARAILSHPAVAPLMLDGHGEVSITWVDPGTGLPCKARIDFLGLAVLDIKTIGTTNEREISRLVTSNLWYGQMAHYRQGLLAHGIDVETYIIAAEGKDAHDVAVCHLGRDAAMYAGEDLRARLMERLAECVRDDEWPGRHPGIVDMDVQQWAYPDPDEDFEIPDTPELEQP